MLPIPSLEPFTSPKILSLPEAAPKVDSWKKQGKTVGLCHGGFDVLHPGHIIHFESAKKLCDVLVVSITSDRFVSSRKGSGRPVFTEQLRAYAVASLSCVDYVVITDYERAMPILEQLRPSYYIKGPDFIGKTTPGITAEREAIARLGGEIKYTNDPKLSTTEIIDYIKTKLDVPELLLVIDRDGTLIEHQEFFGQDKEWKKALRLNDAVADYIAYLQTKYNTTKIVASNQGGVARGFYDCSRVEEIHQEIARQLQAKGIKIDGWQYCPDVDAVYAEAKKNEISFLPSYVKPKTRRKPDPAMVDEGLRALGKELSNFQSILVLGDREEDQGLAANLKATFIDVKGKGWEKLKKEFS